LPESPPDRLLLAAKELFARNGYEQTSTAAIARRAGTSESQLSEESAGCSMRSSIVAGRF
jgi:hypothetical protein